MGTRGLVGFVHGGAEKLAYNHWDSYPDGLGVKVFEWVQSNLNADLRIDPAVVAKIDALVLVDEDASPTPEQWKALSHYANTNVSSGTDWYSLLRECQGDLTATLESGHMIDGHTFALDSLFCEWGYVVDLDAGNLDVYVGFQQTVPTAGRWAGIAGEPPLSGGPAYHAIDLLWSIPFTDVAVMTSEQFAHVANGRDQARSAVGS